MNLSKKQISILHHIANTTCTVEELYKRFEIDGSNFYNIMRPMEEYFLLDLQEPFISSTLTLTALGNAMVENQARWKWSEFRSWCALVIAILAFIKSFFF